MKLRWVIAVVAAVTFTTAPAFARPAPSGTASPTRGKIVYTSKWDGEADIYSMDVLGKSIFNITHDKTTGARTDVQPVWSPSGQYVAFERQYAKGGGADLMVVDAYGTNLHALAPSLFPGTWNCHPSWSEDDVVFFTSNRSGHFELYSIGANGKGLTRLTKTESTVQNLAPAVSPDGKAVVYYRTGNGPLGMTGLYLLKVGSGTSVNLTWTFQGHSDFDPAWSPDGRRIAFTSDRMGSNDIWMVNTDGTNLVRLTSSKFSEAHPAFSPDGRQLAFVSDRTGATEIFTLDLAGSSLIPQVTQLTFDGAFKADPTWRLSSGLPMVR
jgi:Tol biopolymer transport system component